MAPANKLLSRSLAGVAMIAHVVQACAQSRAAGLYVVTGHQADLIEDASRAASPREISFVHAPDYRDGMSASLRAGVGGLPPWIDGALICLGDMPLVETGLIDAMIAAFASAGAGSIIVPQWRGRRGNPVLWDRRYFSQMCGLSGDVGARGLLGRYAAHVVTVEARGQGIVTDFDTPATMPDGRWHASSGDAEGG